MKAFSPSDFICDTSLRINDIVEQTTSWLVVNPMMGCSLGCEYCFRFKWDPTESPYEKTPTSQSIRNLLEHELFVPDITPLSANVSSTDSLLPKVKKSTFAIIKHLDDAGYKNIFGLITKLRLKKEDLNFIAKLKHLRIVVLISYAEIPKKIEPISINGRIDNLKALKELNIPTILYFRPLVKGWNDSIDKIEKVLTIGNKYANAIAIGGLRMSPEIKANLIKKGINVPNMDSFHPKTLDPEIENKIIKCHKKLNIKIPLFKHTSCAVSNIFKMRNYNNLFLNPDLNCIETCPDYQKSICNKNVY